MLRRFTSCRNRKTFAYLEKEGKIGAPLLFWSIRFNSHPFILNYLLLPWKLETLLLFPLFFFFIYPATFKIWHRRLLTVTIFIDQVVGLQRKHEFPSFLCEHKLFGFEVRRKCPSISYSTSNAHDLFFFLPCRHLDNHPRREHLIQLLLVAPDLQVQSSYLQCWDPFYFCRRLSVQR